MARSNAFWPGLVKNGVTFASSFGRILNTRRPDRTRDPLTPRGHPTPMPTPFSSQDLGRIFGARALTRGRTLGSPAA